MYRHRLIRDKIEVIKTRQQKHRKEVASRITLKSATVVAVAMALTTVSLSLFLHPAHAITPPVVFGELPYQKMISQPLTDRSALEVNVANGNVLLKTQDLSVGGAGPALSVTRYFNGQSTTSGQTGSHGTLSVGPDVSITPGAGGSAIYQGPSGFQVTFPSNGSSGYTTPSTYNGAKLATVSGGGWKLTYNQNGEVYTFNAGGKLIKDENAAGLAVTYAYNTGGTLASATDAQGKVTTFGNYSGTKVGLITDPSGRTIQYTYNTSGQLSDVTDTNGKTWHFEYWDGHNLTWIVDPRNNSTTIGYDSSNRVTSINYNDFTAAKTTWTYTYDNTDGKTTVTDPLTHNTTYTWDGSGRVTDVLNAVGDHKGTSWDANNNATASTDSFSHATSYTYDALNNLTAKQNPTTSGGQPGAKDTYDFTDPLHPYLPSKKTSASGNIVSYSYNTAGSLLSATSSASGGTGMGATTSTYQGDPSGSATVNCGAKAGQICTSTDANGNTTTFGYDTHGNVTTVTPPAPLGVKTYTYDSLSRIKTYTDGNGYKTTYTYDNADRITAQAYASSGTTISYTYDQSGNLTQRVDGTGTTTWTYDGYNRITKIQQTGKPDLNYTYDTASNLKTEQGSFGTVTYSYDNANQVTRINQPNGANQDFAYTDGKVTSAWLPGNIVETLSYDNAGRQTSIKAVKNGTTTLTDYTGTYMSTTNKDTELLQKEINNINTGTYTYSYDGLDRLTGVAGANGASSWTYAYDNNGNMTQSTRNSVVTGSYGYNAANQMTGYTAFDNEGNQALISNGTLLSYTDKNQTAAITPGGGYPTVNMAYADAGQSGRTQVGSTAQLNGLLGLYSDTTGTISTYYTHMPGGTNRTVGETIGSSYYYYLTDLHGSTVKMTDGSGNVINTYDYEPYGRQIASTGTVANPIGYANGYYDTSTDLYKYGARYYNANQSRWTQLDPSGQNPGYNYAGDNPVNFSDPSGEFTYTENEHAAAVGCSNNVKQTLLIEGLAYAYGAEPELGAAVLGGACALGLATGYLNSAVPPNGGVGYNAIDTFLSGLRVLELLPK